MASYIPGVTDYIPHIQPFRPDLNFYQAALERKESQYKEGYNKLNSIYGSLLNSPMLGTVDNETRDKFFKDIESNVQKVSGMDLSLQENVDTAYQVFQPLIDDKNIMKNIAWTRNYQNELSRGEGYRNCIDEKACGGKWWDGGVRALNYQAEDFAKEADNHNALSVENPRYTPYINVQKNVMENAKNMGFDIKSVTHSKDGRYIITQKNGAPMYAPLADYFLGAFGNDPATKEMYNTQAYLNRKDFMRSSAQIYGSEDAAENFYLGEAMNSITKISERGTKKITGAKEDVQSKKALIGDKINKSGGVTQDDSLVKQYLSLMDQSQSLDNAESHHSQTLNYLDKSALIGADKKAIRWRVDNAVANNLLTNELLNAAKTYSDLNSETKLEADPYAKSYYDHSLRLSELHESHLNALELNKVNYKNKLDYDNALLNLKKQRKGPMENQVWAPAPDQFQTKSSTADIIDTEAELQDKFIEQHGKVYSNQDVYLKTLYNHLDSLVKAGGPAGVSAAKDLTKIFGNDYDEVNKRLKTEDLVEGTNYKTNRPGIYQFAKDYINQNSDLYTGLNDKLKPIQDKIQTDTDLWLTFDKIKADNLKSLKQWAKSSSEVPEDKREMFQTLITDKGAILTKDQFVKKWAEDHTPKEDRPSSSSYAWAPSGTSGPPVSNAYEVSKKQAEDKYDEIVDLHAKLYRSNPSVGGKPVIKAWDASPQLGGIAGTFAGGKTTNAVITHIDGASEDEGLMDLMRVFDGYKQNGALSVSYGYGQDKLPEDDPAAKAVFERFVGDLKNGNYKDTDLKRPTGDVIFSGVALGDPTKVAFHIIPDSNWGEQTKYKGTPKSPGITAEGKFKEGITVYMDRDKVSKEFINKFERGPYETILNFQDVTVNDYPEDGSITLSKKGSAGIDITGNVNWWDGKKYVSENAASLGLNPYTSPDLLVSNIKYLMKLNHDQNQMTKSSTRSGGPITNVNQLTPQP